MNAAFMQYDPRAGRSGGGRHGTAGSHASHKGTATTTGHSISGITGRITKKTLQGPPVADTWVNVWVV